MYFKVMYCIDSLSSFQFDGVDFKNNLDSTFYKGRVSEDAMILKLKYFSC